jgi:hypothetical protein
MWVGGGFALAFTSQLGADNPYWPINISAYPTWKLQLLMTLNLSQGIKAQSAHVEKMHCFVCIDFGVNDPTTTSCRTINKNTFMWMWVQNFVNNQRLCKLCELIQFARLGSGVLHICEHMVTFFFTCTV